jgi:hypothetical protein
LDGNYRGLNGLGLGDKIGRNSTSPQGKGFELVTPNLTGILRCPDDEGLENGKSGAKIPGIPANPSLSLVRSGGNASVFMSSKPFSHRQGADKQVCKHPRVQIVSREEDAEFVECLECREVFESSELKDMSIEESDEIEDQEL